jgi:hypothetical protein
VGYWSLDEGTSTNAIDLSGNQNNGTWYGTATGTSGYYSPGKIGPWGGAFDGSSTVISIPTTGASSSVGTISFWLKTTTTSGTPSLITTAGTVQRIYFTLSSGVAYFSLGNPQTQVGNGFTVSTGTWYFVAGTWSGTQGTFYANGSPSGGPTVIPALTVVQNPMFVGSFGVGGGNYFNGLIDDVRIYNRALSAAEIQALYNAEK